MQSRWTEKNINLDLLSERIERFLVDKGFKTLREKSVDGCKILGVLNLSSGERESVCVRVFGNPNDFVVEFRSSEPSNTSLLFSPLGRLVGAGALFLRRLRLQEAYEKLEREFWAYLDQTVSDLFDSFGLAR